VTTVRLPRALRSAQLLDAALALLAEDGFAALTMEAVARRAGVSRLVVYRSFRNRDALVVALLRREQARTEHRLDAVLAGRPGDEEEPRAVLLGTLARFLDAVAADPLTWRLALAPPEAAPAWLRAVVDRRRAGVERRLRPLAAWASARAAVPAGTLDQELLSRLLLTLAEEHGRLLLEGLPRERLLAGADAVLGAVPWATRAPARDAPAPAAGRRPSAAP
jgi:AcrR family transcriptional regulator